MQAPEFLAMNEKYSPIDSRWDPLRCCFTVKMTDTYFIDVLPMIYTAAIVITLRSNIDFYDDRWCYSSIPEALAAAEAWDPTVNSEPAGWHRHPVSGRRRPNGDPTLEYVSP